MGLDGQADSCYAVRMTSFDDITTLGAVQYRLGILQAELAQTTAERNAAIVACYANRYSQRQIAKITGLSKQRIGQILTESTTQLLTAEARMMAAIATTKPVAPEDLDLSKYNIDADDLAVILKQRAEIERSLKQPLGPPSDPSDPS